MRIIDNSEKSSFRLKPFFLLYTNDAYTEKEIHQTLIFTIMYVATKSISHNIFWIERLQAAGNIIFVQQINFRCLIKRNFFWYEIFI